MVCEGVREGDGVGGREGRQEMVWEGGREGKRWCGKEGMKVKEMVWEGGREGKRWCGKEGMKAHTHPPNQEKVEVMGEGGEKVTVGGDGDGGEIYC
ncbi:hypothetical protein Pcinc_002456 [Petrolisthes cinctipes]|uniref:Uncharacterized protein n=1 Tax=Petrolisthes cinctipes TaxID=88211 RepID=A0AAE1L2Z3_PETCI|nr:hypothetical protein Pcinc_002456 [Petrolisthes cinctipes]